MENEHIYDYNSTIKQFNEISENFVRSTARLYLDETIMEHSYVKFKIGTDTMNYSNILFLSFISKKYTVVEKNWQVEIDKIKLEIENFYKQLGEDIKK